jgi:hypothetical protein
VLNDEPAANPSLARRGTIIETARTKPLFKAARLPKEFDQGVTLMLVEIRLNPA